MTQILLTGQNKNKAASSGFSLIELLVVLTIISIMVSSISHVVINSKDSLNDKKNKIVQKLRIVQQKAVRDNLEYQVEINLSNNRIYFVDDFVELSEDVAITVRTAKNQIIDNELVGLTFYPDSSSSGGVITLESETDVYVISIVWISGKIFVEHKGV